jgi:hypothetical protein
VGCVLANSASVALATVAFAAAARSPALLDSPGFASFLSAFCGCVSNLEGVAASAWGFVLHPESRGSARKRAEGLAWSAVVVAANLNVAFVGAEAVRQIVLRSGALAEFTPEPVW